MVLGNDEHIAGGNLYLTGIKGILQGATCTEHDENEVHKTGIAGNRNLSYAVGQYQVLVNMGYATPSYGIGNVGFFDL